MRAMLVLYRSGLDPVLLLHTIREAQSALVAATSPEVRETPSGESLSKFPADCPGCGGRVKSGLPMWSVSEVPGTGGPARIPSRVFGATSLSGCKPNRRPPARP